MRSRILTSNLFTLFVLQKREPSKSGDEIACAPRGGKQIQIKGSCRSFEQISLEFPAVPSWRQSLQVESGSCGIDFSLKKQRQRWSGQEEK